MRLEPLHLLVGSVFVWGCAQVVRPEPAALDGPPSGGEPPRPDEPLEPVRDLYVFVHEASLISPVLLAAGRIERASGIKIHVNEQDTVLTAAPLFGSDFLCANGPGGRVDRNSGGGFIAIARNCDKYPLEQVIVHELIHMLGVDHLVLPQKGIMNDGRDNPSLKITEDDLNALCAVRACTVFQPEA